MIDFESEADFEKFKGSHGEIAIEEAVRDIYSEEGFDASCEELEI